MKVSVLIPAYNCEATIRPTLDSVLRQTVRPDEILVADDGSTDNTPSVLESYKPHVTVFPQRNGGPSSARNALVARARGELIAFLDSDDILHPRYIETQLRLFREYRTASGFFMGHVNFYGNGSYEWDADPIDAGGGAEVLPPLTFFERFNHSPGPFASCSFFCIPRWVLSKIGPEPFKADGAEDFYCCALLSLMGSVVYNPLPLVAYRIIEGSHSSSRLRGLGARVLAFELLEDRFKSSPDSDRSRAFGVALASHRRSYAKYLIGAGRITEGRTQLWRSSRNAIHPVSIAKSMGMLWSTYLPKQLQPSWPSTYQR